jgi:mycothiol synthase
VSGHVHWRQLDPADLPAIGTLHAAALAVDGGSPFAAADWLLRRWYVDDVDASLVALCGDELIAVSARRYPAAPAGSPWKIAGLVAPGHRGQGVGGRLLDAMLDGTATVAPVQVETESLTQAADDLYRSRGLHQTFAEDVMSMPLARLVPAVTANPGFSFIEWTKDTAPRFYAVWEAAFRERPGFPGWATDTWIRWITEDEDFRADWTLLASAGDADLGFVVGAAGGWIVQVGVVPAARGRRISALMMTEVFGRMIAAGETRAVLTVNVNNPSAIAVYQRIGLARIGRRARYERGLIPDGVLGREG